MRGENVGWCEEMRNLGGVFIGGNGNLVCIYHKCGKKTCRLNVEKLTKDQKTFVLQLLPPANVRELTRAHASMHEPD